MWLLYFASDALDSLLKQIQDVLATVLQERKTRAHVLVHVDGLARQAQCPGVLGVHGRSSVLDDDVQELRIQTKQMRGLRGLWARVLGHECPHTCHFQLGKWGLHVHALVIVEPLLRVTQRLIRCRNALKTQM